MANWPLAVIFLAFLCVFYKPNRYKILSNKELFRGHKYISGEIFANNYVQIVWFIIFFDKFTMFNPNIHEIANLADSE